MQTPDSNLPKPQNMCFLLFCWLMLTSRSPCNELVGSSWFPKARWCPPQRQQRQHQGLHFKACQVPLNPLDAAIVHTCYFCPWFPAPNMLVCTQALLWDARQVPSMTKLRAVRVGCKIGSKSCPSRLSFLPFSLAAVDLACCFPPSRPHALPSGCTVSQSLDCEIALFLLVSPWRSMFRQAQRRLQEVVPALVRAALALLALLMEMFPSSNA